MWWMILAAAALWGIQGLFGFWQMKHFNGRFKALRGEGRVAVGRSRGRFLAGVVVLFCIDIDGTIKKAEKMSGVTSLARLQPFERFNNCNLLTLTELDCQGIDGQTRKAVLNAVENYQTFIDANKHNAYTTKAEVTTA